MKISIRYKIFVVLLAFSLGPLFISRGFMGEASTTVVKDTTDQTRNELLHIIASELEYNASSLLSLLEGSGRSMKLGVRSVALKAEQAFADAQPDLAAKVYFTRDFANPDSQPPDAMTHTDYFRRTMSGRERPIKISFGHPAVYLPRSVNREAVKTDLLLLQQLTPVLKEVVHDLEDAPYWINVGLESGAFLTYPGHGGFPAMYDHRDQDWYRLTKASESLRWYATLDPATRSTNATVAYPIKSATGAFLGCVSINVPHFAMMGEEELQRRWEGEMRSFMVGREPSGDTQGKGLPIIAQRESGRKGHHWMSGIEKEWLTFDDPVGTEVLLHAMDMQKSGVVPLSYNGQNSVCAFATSPLYSFIIIAPKTVVSRLPNQVAGNLSLLFDEMRNISLIVSGFMLLFTGLIAWFGSRAITKPLFAMNEVARRLTRGDFSARIPMHTGDERDDLIESFNEMGPKLKELMQLNKDMELAQEVQRLMLPHAEPYLEGFDISGGIAYCDQTGGDYYDFLSINHQDGQELVVLIGDVSGHGVPSALVMAAARGQFHTLSKIGMEPHERMQSVNSVLSRDLDGTGRFLTMFYLRLMEKSSVVQWVRAGHDPAVRYNPCTGEFGELLGEGLPLGVLEEFEFATSEAALNEGEVLVLATDGVWEARDDRGEMFGKQRMLAIIKENAHKSSVGIRLALMDAVEQYQGGGQEDDIAVVVVKKMSEKCMPGKSLLFRMTNKENCFKCFQPKIEAFGAANGLHGKVTFHLTLVLDELITNIIDYGYADFDEHPINVSIGLDGNMLTVRLEDDSEPFNILEAPEPELDVPLEERQRPIGGMGIHLVKSMVHDIQYVREGGKNVLTLSKDISKSCSENKE